MAPITRTAFFTAALCLGAGAAHAQTAKTNAASDYPTRPIRLIVPVPPGGSSDGMARIVGQRLTEAWGQQVIIDNRAGAAGIIAGDILAKSNPDGYAIGLMSLRFSVNPSLMKQPFDTMRDFEPIIMTAAVGNVLVVNPKSPIKSVKDLLALARQKPGELTFASSGIGGAPHLIGEFLALQTGVKLTHIAYKGGGPAIADLIGGNVTMSFASTTSSMPFIKSGRLRPLAVSSKTRSPHLPDVPTMAEAGVPNVEVRDWQGLVGPRGLSPALVNKLNAEVARILRHPENQERFAVMGLEPIASTPREFRDEIASEIKRWARVVKEANIKAD
jgi:tripartite-type tricarboxylate transporter receptor subunit TctC